MSEALMYVRSQYSHNSNNLTHSYISYLSLSLYIYIYIELLIHVDIIALSLSLLIILLLSLSLPISLVLLLYMYVRSLQGTSPEDQPSQRGRREAGSEAYSVV